MPSEEVKTAMNLSGIEVASALVVVAHPDDAEFGAGGTIARMAAEGAEVTICVVSNGAMGSNDPDVARDALIATREREQRAAADRAPSMINGPLNLDTIPGLRKKPRVRPRSLQNDIQRRDR